MRATSGRPDSHASASSTGTRLWTGQQQRHAAAIRGAVDRGRGALILGSPGVGKSHLMALVLSSMTNRTPTFVAPEPVVLPLAADRETLASMLGITPIPSSQQAALDAVRELLPPSDGTAPVVAIDGVHLLDRASAEVLAHLARRRELTLLAAARPSAGSVAPWHALWHDGVVDRIDLAELTLAECESVLMAELGGPARPETARLLWAETGGNARYLQLLVADLLGTGGLHEFRGVWELLGAPTPGPSLLHARMEQLDDLPEAQARVLQTLALAGPLTLGTALDIVERDTLESLQLRGLVRTSTAGGRAEITLDLADRLTARAVHGTIRPESRRTLLHDLSGAEHEGPLSGQTVLMMLADGIDPGRARVRAALAAALEGGRTTDAVSIADAALAHQPATEHPAAHVAAVHLTRARAHHRLGQTLRALADLRAAQARLLRATATVSVDVEIPPLIGDLVLCRADIVQENHGIDAALRVLAGGSRWLLTMPPVPGAAEVGQSLELSRLKRLGHAGRHAEAQGAAVVLLDNAPAPRRLLPLVYPTCLGLLLSGRFDDARRIVRRFRPVAAASTATNPAAAPDIALVGFLAQLWSGEVSSLEGLGSGGTELVPGPERWTGTPMMRGLLAAACGAWSAARRELRTANSDSPAHQLDGVVAYALAAEALAAAASGEDIDARALLTAVDAVPAETAAVLEPALGLLRLDTLIWLQDDVAAAAAHALAEQARALGAAHIEIEALHRTLLLRRRGQSSADPAALDRIHELRPHVRSGRAAALAQHTDALNSDDAGLLGIAERELNRRGLWLPPGKQARALTAREREVAALAGARLTTRLIASRLGLSTRTVDSHIASVFMKLGVTSREDLSLALS